MMKPIKDQEVEWKPKKSKSPDVGTYEPAKAFYY